MVMFSQMVKLYKDDDLPDYEWPPSFIASIQFFFFFLVIGKDRYM